MTYELVVESTIAAARRITEQSVTVVLLMHGLKKPLINASGTWLTFDDPVDVETEIKNQSNVAGCPNLGILLHPKGASNIICVDVDGANPIVTSKLKACGVTREDLTWTQSTGKRNGHYHIFYRWNEEPLPRVADKPDGIDIDLLTNGYAVVAPSNTYREPDGGGPYTWVKDHSIFDISLPELAEPPVALIDWWLSRRIEIYKDERSTRNLGDWLPGVVNSPIHKSTRNSILVKIAGSLRTHYDSDTTTAFLHAINEARCTPPLSSSEVAKIAASVDRMENGKNSHFRAVPVAPMEDST